MKASPGNLPVFADSDAPTPSPAPLPLAPENGILTLFGRARIAVRGGCLICHDETPDGPRVARIERTDRLSRLVCLDPDGYITFDSLAWLRDVGAAWVSLDGDGELLATSTVGGPDFAHLRRAQALAASTDTGLAISRHFIGAKLDGQARVMDDQRKTLQADAIRSRRQLIDGAASLDDLRRYEGQCATWYWDALQSTPIPFARAAVGKVPASWAILGPRASRLTGTARKASSFGHAVLNYLYKLAEVETRLAIQGVGLDVGVGVLHSDEPSRDNLVFDLIEPCRPLVDRWALDYFGRSTFSYTDAAQDRDGAVRLHPRVKAQLCRTLPLWRSAIGPYVEWTAKTLAASSHKATIAMPTPLTEKRRSNGRPRSKARDVRPNDSAGAFAVASPGDERRAVSAVAIDVLTGEMSEIGKRTQPVDPEPARTSSTAHRAAPKIVSARCQVCGASLDDPENGRTGHSTRVCCDACLPRRRAEQVDGFAASGPQTLAASRAAGVDPAHGGDAGARRAQTTARKNAERREWDAAHPTSDADAARDRFATTILPRLASVPLSDIQLAIDCSPRYASSVRSGRATPHPRHVAALEALVNGKGG